MAELIVGDDFIDFIEKLGFKHQKTETRRKYFSNATGKQIRVDIEKKLVALLDKTGFVVRNSGYYTEEDIHKFIVS